MAEEIIVSSPLVNAEGNPLVSFSSGDLEIGEEWLERILGCGLEKRICPNELVITGTLIGLEALEEEGLEGRSTLTILTCF